MTRGNEAYSLLELDATEEPPDDAEQKRWFRRHVGEPFLVVGGLLKLGMAWWAFQSVAIGGLVGLLSVEVALGLGWIFVGIGVAEIVGGILAYRSVGMSYTMIPTALAMGTLVTFPLDYFGYTNVLRESVN